MMIIVIQMIMSTFEGKTKENVVLPKTTKNNKKQ